MKFTSSLILCAAALGLSTGLAAQGTTPAAAGATTAEAKPAVAAPTPTPAPAYTEAQALEVYGHLLAKKIGLVDLSFNKDEVAAIMRGIEMAAEGKPSPYPEEKVLPILENLMQQKQQAWLDRLRTENENASTAYFAKLKQDKNVVQTPSGLCYEILQPGEGAYPKPTDTVKVHYTGKLLDGTVFDSSLQRGEPVEFAVDKVIPGWSEGIQKINKGGKIRLYVPAKLAYGDTGAQGIPPGSALIFDVELLDINPPAAPAAAPAPAPQAPTAN